MEITCNDEETHKTVMIIKRQVEQLTSLVDDLLDISRIEQKMIKFKKQDMVLNTTIINSIESMRAEFNRMGVDLIDEIEEHPILVNADNIRMSQCIHNILVNALKFTDKGGRVKTSLHKEGNQAVITVKDNGIGISSNMLELIFKTFSQDHTSSQISNNMGLGLGLSIVKDIIEMHGGQADVYSKGLGQGSTFTLKIPTI